MDPELSGRPRSGEESARFDAVAIGGAHVNQAGRDLHLHYADGVRRVEPGAVVQECPYPGLASFGREQARWFFGRDQLTAALITRLDARLRVGGMQVVVAPSGAGKSSLLQAGLLPQLEVGALPGSSRWPRIVLTPTAQPLAALAAEIAALTGADPVILAEELAADPHQAEAVLRGLLSGDSEARVVVVADQCEELFTLCSDDQQRRAFIGVLAQLANPPQPVGLVVVGVRADFYAACADYPHLLTALQDNQLVVGPMSDTDLRAAIRYPAQAVGLDVEAGLVDLLLRDLGDTAGGMSGSGAGRLPLLAHALRATWQQRHGHLLTVDGYRATGGIQCAVATTAEGVFTTLDPAGRHAAQALFLRLIKIGDGTEDTRRRVARADLLRGLDPGRVGPVVDAFTDGRLLTQERDTVEITHEALVRAWPRLRQWIDTDRAGNLIRQDLEDAAAVWDRDRRDTAGLYRGSRLEAARTSTANEGDPSPTVSQFLAASTQQEHRATRLRRTVLVVLSVLALVASGTAVVAFQQRVTAQQERDTATFNQITAQADRLRDKDLSLAAQLDLTAYRMRPTSDRYTALVTDANTALSTPLTGHTGTVYSVAFSPDRRTLATGSADRTVRLWNVADPTHPTLLGRPLAGYTNYVHAVAFSPNGHTLASSGAETVRLWNVTDPAHATPLGPPLTGHTKFIVGVAFSPDGRTLASSSADRTVRLWNVVDPARPTPLGQPLTNAASAVAFSPDGHTLAGSGDETVQLWNLTDPAHPTSLGRPLTGHTHVVQALAFSSDGHTLASGGDRTVRVWNVINPTQRIELTQPFTGHVGVVTAVAFSPDGNTLASGSDDQTVRLWSIPRTLLTGHIDTVYSVAFSPDGRTLASASEDHTVRLWNVADPANPTQLGQLLTDHTNTIFSVAFSPDGRTLATGSTDNTVRLWNVTDPAHPTQLGQPLPGHISPVSSVVFSPDGRTLATASNQTVRLWNVIDPTHPTPLGQPLISYTEDAEEVAFSPDGHTLANSHGDIVFLWNVTDPTHPTPLGEPLTGHTNAIETVAFSPDGRTLATGSLDETVRLWNVTEPTHPTPLGQPLTGHTSFVNGVAFSPDGRTLASGGDDGTVRLWETDVDQVIQRICATTRNTLTPEKWEQYVSKDLPYHPPCS